MKLNKLLDFVREKNSSNVDVNSNEIFKVHEFSIKKKPLLRSAYKTFYKDMLEACDRHFSSDGLEIELGSGVGFFKEIKKNIITSEYKSRGLAFDMELDATNMKLLDNSVKCFYAINVFHHISFPTKFFEELDRVLIIGGGCILIEPHLGFLSKLLFKNIHKEEYFDEHEKEWDSFQKNGPMNNANQALAHNIFERDELLFEKKYGNKLKIIDKRYILNGFRFICSGGLGFKQILPSFTLNVLKAIELIFSPIAKFWTPFRMIVIKKIN
tara:strand:- start:461 stop:1267 length:807 start_codon:yes stop_codon:yes gene_type:complete